MHSTKQLRLNAPDHIREKSKDFLNKKVNVVLKNNTVIFGEVVHVDSHGLYLKNMRLKKNYYPFESISELYFDRIE